MMALSLSMRNTSTRSDKFTIGRYLVNNQRGIRVVPYSIDEKIDPLTCKKFSKFLVIILTSRH